MKQLLPVVAVLYLLAALGVPDGAHYLEHLKIRLT